jgi:hydrogenase nickel incorporation protein HypB
MCATCGCSVTPHDHVHTVTLEQKVLAHNDELAEVNRKWLAERQILMLNLMSSPGSGKTTLLEQTIRTLPGEFSVIEGDQETLFDTERIRATGCRAIQINTGAGCHLDASMLADALETLDPPRGSVLFVENVGNLVCPALFDLGESGRVVITSVAEGEDKPLKYPHMFRTADLVVLNKIDLLPYVPFRREVFREHLSMVNTAAPTIEVSATRKDGLTAWHAWLKSRVS